MPDGHVVVRCTVRITMQEMRGVEKLLAAKTGSRRYGYAVEGSNTDMVYITANTNAASMDAETGNIHYAWSARTAQRLWGHPLLMGALAGNCQGGSVLCAWLAEHRAEIAYAAPFESAMHGMACIAMNEKTALRSGAPTAVKTALLVAFILRHMAEGQKDPFMMATDEKAVLARAREGAVGVEERAAIYRETICPENLDRLRKMPGDPSMLNGFMKLLNEAANMEEEI